MRCLRMLLMTGLLLVFTAGASAVSVPLPPNGDMNIDAFGAFAEIFVEVLQDTELPGAGVVPAGTLLNNLAIGYTKDSDGAGTPDFVLYTGAASTTGAAQTAPGTVVLIGGSTITELFTGQGGFEDVTVGRLYVGGVIQSIATESPGGVPLGTETYATSAADTDDVQLTFSLYNSHVTALTLEATSAGGQSGFITTEFELEGGDAAHLDIWADAVADATLTAPVGAGLRYGSAAGLFTELPVRETDGSLIVDLDDGTYWDRNTTGWGELGFAGDSDDEVFWSFVGNPESNLKVVESFQDTGEVLAMPNVSGGGPTTLSVLVQGPSDISDPGFKVEGQFVPGMSLAPAAKTDTGFGHGNGLLTGDYLLSGEFVFGSGPTDTYDSDPGTFTFQQGAGSDGQGDLTQLSGALIPEPVTMAGMFLGLGSLVGYVRKRRK